jgi:hypothetical protein
MAAGAFSLVRSRYQLDRLRPRYNHGLVVHFGGVGGTDGRVGFETAIAGDSGKVGFSRRESSAFGRFSQGPR